MMDAVGFFEGIAPLYRWQKYLDGIGNSVLQAKKRVLDQFGNTTSPFSFLTVIAETGQERAAFKMVSASSSLQLSRITAFAWSFNSNVFGATPTQGPAPIHTLASTSTVHPFERAIGPCGFVASFMFDISFSLLITFLKGALYGFEREEGATGASGREGIGSEECEDIFRGEFFHVFNIPSRDMFGEH